MANILHFSGLILSPHEKFDVIVMVKKQRTVKPIWKQNLPLTIAKVSLALVATGSFAIVFGQEKINEMTLNSNPCLNQFYKEVQPQLQRESLKKHSYPLCFNGFNVMYSGVSKTPLWVAEYLTPARLKQKIKREDNFHVEDRVAPQHRALLSDYRGSGYDRGHMAPNGDMPNTAAQYDSFSLANMVPQTPQNNQKIWRELEEATRAMVTKQKQNVYVVTGPEFSGKNLNTIGKGRVLVPTATYKAIYIPKTGVIGVYYASNDMNVSNPKVQVISVCELEEKVGINIFPQLNEEQKRNVYNLPLTAHQVRAKANIGYKEWDAKSQCGIDVPKAETKALQKLFKPDHDYKVSDSDVSDGAVKIEQAGQEKPEINADTAGVLKIIMDIVQFLLQFLK